MVSGPKRCLCLFHRPGRFTAAKLVAVGFFYLFIYFPIENIKLVANFWVQLTPIGKNKSPTNVVLMSLENE